MKGMKYYDIHGIVKVVSNVEHYPEHFRVAKIPEKDLDIVVKLGDFNFDKTGCERVGSFWGGNNSLYIEYKTGAGDKQKILVTDLFGRPTLKFSKLTYRYFHVEQFMHLMTMIKLLQKGCVYLHSAAVAKGDKGYLITGWSEMGKSSTVFGLSNNHEFGIMGDDTVILSKDGFIYCYPVVAGVFFHSKNVKNLNLSPSQKFKLMIKYFVSKLPPLYLYINPNLLIDLSTVGKIVDKVKLKKTYFLGRGKGQEKLDKTIAINKIVSSTIHGHDQYFARDVFFAYCYLNGSDPNFIEVNMKKVLESGLGDCVLLRSEKKDFHKIIGRE